MHTELTTGFGTAFITAADFWVAIKAGSDGNAVLFSVTTETFGLAPSSVACATDAVKGSADGVV